MTKKRIFLWDLQNKLPPAFQQSKDITFTYYVCQANESFMYA